MARYLVCIDVEPAPDPGTCTQAVFVEQAGLRDMLPTMEQANIIGPSFCFSLFLVRVAIRTLKPQR